MAGFNVGAGLAAAGDAIGKTAGAMTLEAQKADLQQKAAILADQLATTRESKGRAEQHGYTLETLDKTQKYDAEKTDKQIAADLHRTNISAGASLEGTRLQIAARAAENDKEIAFRTQQAVKVEITPTGEAMSINTITNKVTPLLTADGKPVKLSNSEEARTIGKSLDTLNTQLDRVNDRYTPQLRDLGSQIKELSKDSLYLGNDPKTGKPTEAQQRLDALTAEQKRLLQEWDGARAPLERDLSSLRHRILGQAPGTPGGEIDWNKYMPKPAAPAKPPGLIDGWTP